MNKDELLLKSDRFRVVRRQRQMPDGREFARDVILHPGAVAIVPMVDENHVCLIRNFRVSLERTLIEVPAGTLEAGEDPTATAHRELAEETGYTSGRLVPLGGIFMSPGILNERIHLFLAHDLSAGSPHREQGEEIDNLVVAWSEALEMIRRGEIDDGKTVAALLYCDRFRRG